MNKAEINFKLYIITSRKIIANCTLVSYLKKIALVQFKNKIAIQIREKDLSTKELLAIITKIHPLFKSVGIKVLIINFSNHSYKKVKELFKYICVGKYIKN